MLIVYGIASCDTVAAARRWLREHGIEHEFHDLRREHVDARTIEGWLAAFGRERLVNRASATWRLLDQAQRRQVESGNPVPVLLANPTLLKRPVLVDGAALSCGFDPAEYERLFVRG
ncbi:MAG: hypothetical protein CALGDGBN_00338 [Pseudomonadales bacterium]|nr:hypothetical protein [Pseudomonadales bacterium]